MKLVINSDFGGFSISQEAKEWLLKKGMTIEQIYELEEHENRANKLFVQCVEELEERANGFCASLKVVEYDKQPYYIEEYDGAEAVVLSSDFVMPKYKFD